MKILSSVKWVESCCKSHITCVLKINVINRGGLWKPPEVFCLTIKSKFLKIWPGTLCGLKIHLWLRNYNFSHWVSLFFQYFLTWHGLLPFTTRSLLSGPNSVCLLLTESAMPDTGLRGINIPPVLDSVGGPDHQNSATTYLAHID